MISVPAPGAWGRPRFLGDPMRLREFELERDYPAVLALWQTAGPGIHVSPSDSETEIRKKLERDPDLFLLAASLALADWLGGGARSALAATPAAATPPAVEVPVLMYHHIGQPIGHASEDQYFVPLAAFEAQMAYLATSGFNAVSLEQVLGALQGKMTLPAQPVVVTFDDANQDNYDLALPVLEKYHLSATFLIVTGWVGKAGKLTWDEIADMQRAGMHFGAHTVSHPYLPNLPLEAAAREINTSKTDLEAHLGQPVVVFAYPYGHASPSITRLGVYSWTSLSYFKSHLPAPAVSPVPAIDVGANWRTILSAVGFYL